MSLRVRIDSSEAAKLTIKTVGLGIARGEYEYDIPIADAEELMQKCDGIVICKVRHIVPMTDLVWEIDVFEGDNLGLVIAEVELDRVDRPLQRPEWIGEEVTNDRRFYNAALSTAPFTRWAAKG